MVTSKWSILTEFFFSKREFFPDIIDMIYTGYLCYTTHKFLFDFSKSIKVKYNGVGGFSQHDLLSLSYQVMIVNHVSILNCLPVISLKNYSYLLSLHNNYRYSYKKCQNCHSLERHSLEWISLKSQERTQILGSKYREWMMLPQLLWSAANNGQICLEEGVSLLEGT